MPGQYARPKCRECGKVMRPTYTCRKSIPGKNGKRWVYTYECENSHQVDFITSFWIPNVPVLVES